MNDKPVKTPFGTFTKLRDEPHTRKDGTETTLIVWHFTCAACGNGQEVLTSVSPRSLWRVRCCKVHPWRK